MNVQLRGSFTTPSLTPSTWSHAPRTDAAIKARLSGVTTGVDKSDESGYTACWFCTKPAVNAVQ